jgi:hypothetical protein
MTTTFEDLRKAAKLMLSQPVSFSIDDFVRKVEDYVNSLPEWRRNSFFGCIVRVGDTERKYLVRYTELPKLLREDPEFRERYIRALAAL